MKLTKTQHIFICALVFYTTLFLMFPLTTSAQTVNIPDANLRAAIAKTLGKTPNARITAAEMATLTRLEAHDAGISDLTGLEFATELVELRCNNNSISDLSPLAGLMKLAYIGLAGNVITDLSPLEALLNLDWIHVPHNLISDLSPLKGLIDLRRSKYRA